MKRILVTGVLILALRSLPLPSIPKPTMTIPPISRNITPLPGKPKSANGVVANPLVLSRIETAVAELLDQGAQAGYDESDLLVLAHVAARNLQDIDYLPPVGGWRTGAGWGRTSLLTTT